MISNETGTVHIAAALNVKTICISNANHIGRFNPYPTEMKIPTRYIYPPCVERDVKDWMTKNRGLVSNLDINRISVKKCNKKVEQFLTSHSFY